MRRTRHAYRRVLLHVPERVWGIREEAERSGAEGVPSAPPTPNRPDMLHRPVSGALVELNDSRSPRSEARTAASPQLHQTETPSPLWRYAGGGRVLAWSSAR